MRPRKCRRAVPEAAANEANGEASWRRAPSRRNAGPPGAGIPDSEHRTRLSSAAVRPFMPSRTPSAAHRGMGVHGLRTGMNHPSGACSALRPMLISAVKCRARRDRPGACSSPVTRRHTGALPSRFRTVSSRWRMKAAVSSPCPERLSAPMHRTTPVGGDSQRRTALSSRS